MEYKKTSSRSKMAGEWYEVKLAMLVFFRSCNNKSISNFELATNVDGTGAFDDIVYRFVTTDQPHTTHTFFIQLKHKETATLGLGSFQTPTGDFSLNKYLKSFIEIKKGNNRNDCKNELFLKGPFQNFKFLIYTTAPLQNKLLSKLTPGDLGLARDILNTHVEENMTAKFKLECYNEVVSLKNNEQHLSSHIAPFLDKFVLFAKQRSEHELDVLVKKELSCACEEAAGYEEPLYRIVEGLFKKWWRDDRGQMLTESSDILSRAVQKLSFEVELMSQTKRCILDVHFDPRVWKTFSLANLCEGTSVLHVISSGRSCRLTTTKTLHALRARQLSFTCVGLKYFLMRATSIVNEWENGYIDCLVVVVDDLNSHGEESFIFFITLSRKIKDILERNSQKKCVIVSCANSLLANELIKSVSIDNIETINDTFQNHDLDVLSREKLLKQTVSLQGCDIELKMLINNDILEKLLDENVIEELASPEKFLIGGHLPDVIPYFISRYFRRRLVETTVLADSTLSNLLVVSGEIDSLETVIPQASQVDRASLLSTSFFVPNFTAAKAKYDNLSQVRGNVHWLHHEYGTLNWIQSSKTTVFIKSHLTNIKMDGENLIALNDRVVVIIAEPGMGKTTLLSEMVRIMKRTNPSHWVIHLNLSDYCNLFEPTTPLSALDFLSSALSVTPLERAILRSGLEDTGNVSVLLDSFDEVCPAYEEEACALVRSLLDTRIRKLVVTSRHCSENTLKLLLLRSPVNLVEFTESDQRRFFEKFWAQLASPERLDYVITKVINTMNTIDPDKKIMGIPLQTMMVAEVFHGFVMDPDNNAFTENLDIIDLYQKFIDKKFKIFYTKIKDKTLRKLEIKNNFQKDHMYTAMLLLFSLEDIRTFTTSDDIIEISNSFLSRTNEARDNSGIVLRSMKNKPVFIHKTFAEYFAALCFSIHYEHNSQFFNDHIFKSENHFVRLLFDRILAKGYPLHNAVLNRDVCAIKALLDEGVDVAARDSGGRTALHLASALGMEIVSTLHNNIFFDDARFIGPLNQHPVRLLLEHGAAVNVSDYVLQKTPLEYALETQSLDSVELLLGYGAIAKGSILWDPNSPKTLLRELTIMVCNGYIHFLTTLFKKSENRELPIDVLRQKGGETLLQKACFVGYEDVVNLLLDTHFLPYINKVDKFGCSFLFYACRGMQYNIIRLLILKRANYLYLSLNGYSCLHYASFWGFTLVVKTLLDAVAEAGHSDSYFVNTQTKRGEFALSIALENFHTEIVKLLLSRGADVSVLDSHGLTCLHTACMRGDTDILSALVQRVTSDGASVVTFVNTLSQSGVSPLRVACRHQQWEIIHLLVSLGACHTDCHSCLLRYCVWGDINVVRALVDSIKEKGDSIIEFVNTPNSEGDLPLSLARRYKNSEVVKFLVSCCAQSWDFVIEALCDACKTDDESKVQTIIEYVKDIGGSVEDFVNVLGESGRSPLTLACDHHSLKVVQTLVSHGCDVLTVDSHGSPSLHVASDRGNIAVVSILVDHMTARRMSIDVPNVRGETALSRACRYGHLDVVRLLLSAGADVTIHDQDGFTCLHNACISGDKTVVQTLVEHARARGKPINRFLNMVSVSRVSPWDLAVRHNRLDIINYFLSLRERIKIK